ncbi:MAG: hypothetical protein KGL12_03510 [Rhodospirillales bacterium]|nr:hypothetical protein [Rhodospirillales bacterium]
MMLQRALPSRSIAAAGLLAAACVALGSAPALAGTSPNLLTNGSFETIGTGTNISAQGSQAGVGNLPGWTVSQNTTGYSWGSGPGLGPELITTNGSTVAPYGDKIAADPFTYGPDGAGSYALYFVDDNAHETISQSISMVAGTTYEVGFDLFQTLSGANNPGNFTLKASLGSSVITEANQLTLTAGIWYHFAATYVPTTTGIQSFVFDYTSANATSKDVVVDQVYVEDPPTTPGVGPNTGNAPIGTPEPRGVAMFAVALGALAMIRRPRRVLRRA